MLRFVLALLVVAVSLATDEIVPVPVWNGKTGRDLHGEYNNIFKHGNRNAASHLWSTFIIQRAPQMSRETLLTMFGAYCAVSGSPVRSGDYNRYKLTLNDTLGGSHTGFMHYCCWPCVCDTQDFIRIDTKTIMHAGGAEEFHVAVIGNPCLREERLDEPFVQPFDGRTTTIRRDAREVRCSSAGELVGATLSDNGFIIIAMFFDFKPDHPESASAGLLQKPNVEAEPGRVSEHRGTLVQDEAEYQGWCSDRAAKGYNSGMGEIFRRVAMISPIDTTIELPALGSSGGLEGETCMD